MDFLCSTKKRKKKFGFFNFLPAELIPDYCSDPWLDALDQDPYHQGVNVPNEETDQNRDEFHPINTKNVKNPQILDEEKEKKEPLSGQKLAELAISLVDLLEVGQTPNQLIQKLKPKTQKARTIYKKNIRKNKEKDKKEGGNISEEEEKQAENKEKFAKVIELCDLLSSNGCLGTYPLFF